MIVEVITIGDEILSGDILDTNKQYLSEQCWLHGFEVQYHTGIRDDEQEIYHALEWAADRADVVLVTGGLGPTADDFTIEVAAKVFDVDLVQNEEVIRFLKERYEKRGRRLSENNKKQADVPDGAEVFLNDVGTAPAIYYDFEGTHFYFMPGVPREMKYLFTEKIKKHLLSRKKDNRHFEHIFFKLFGAPESDLDQALKDLYDERTAIKNVRIGFRAHFPEVFIKMSAWDENTEKTKAKLQVVVDEVEKRLGKFIYSRNLSDTLESVLVQKLQERKKTIAFAESCTGGRLASRITDISGASQVFLGGIVSYSNDVKKNVLKVPEDILEIHGAVSRECAEAMVKGIHELTQADFCAAVTGIAGPTGGSEDKPVGTVWIALLCDGELSCKKYFFPFHREWFKEITTSTVFAKFLKRLKA